MIFREIRIFLFQYFVETGRSQASPPNLHFYPTSRVCSFLFLTMPSPLPPPSSSPPPPPTSLPPDSPLSERATAFLDDSFSISQSKTSLRRRVRGDSFDWSEQPPSVKRSHAYMLTRAMTPRQELANALTMLPGIALVIFMFWSSTDRLTPNNTSPALSAVLAVLFHTPFSILYHVRCITIPPGFPRTTHVTRRLDQALIQIASALFSFSTSGSIAYATTCTMRVIGA